MLEMRARMLKVGLGKSEVLEKSQEMMIEVMEAEVKKLETLRGLLDNLKNEAL